MYLARFYLAVQQGLAISPVSCDIGPLLDVNNTSELPCLLQDQVVSEVLAMILVNSSDLLRLDLDGVNVLLPHLVTALEAVLPERELKLRPTNVHKTELRRAGINILVSMLALPAHFQNLALLPLAPGLANEPASFSGLKARMVNLLINALQVETEPTNTHILLGIVLNFHVFYAMRG